MLGIDEGIVPEVDAARFLGINQLF